MLLFLHLRRVALVDTSADEHVTHEMLLGSQLDGVAPVLHKSPVAVYSIRAILLSSSLAGLSDLAAYMTTPAFETVELNRAELMRILAGHWRARRDPARHRECRWHAWAQEARRRCG